MTDRTSWVDPFPHGHGDYGEPSSDEPWQVAALRSQVLFGLEAATFIIEATQARIDSTARAAFRLAEREPGGVLDASTACIWGYDAQAGLGRLASFLKGEREAVLAGDASHLSDVAADAREEEEVMAWLKRRQPPDPDQPESGSA